MLCRSNNSRVLQSYALENFRPGDWVQTQRAAFVDGSLDADRQRRLEKLPGWTWCCSHLGLCRASCIGCCATVRRLQRSRSASRASLLRSGVDRAVAAGSRVSPLGRGLKLDIWMRRITLVNGAARDACELGSLRRLVTLLRRLDNGIYEQRIDVAMLEGMSRPVRIAFIVSFRHRWPSQDAKA